MNCFYGIKESTIFAPLVNKNDRCIFCLGRFSIEQPFIEYTNDCIKIRGKKYKMNCSCRAFSHEYCMDSWLLESALCPECSVDLTHIVREQKKGFCYNSQVLCCVFYVSVMVVSFVGLVVFISINYSHFKAIH
jgi:hypothetical protein